MPTLREAAWEERAVDITYTDREGSFTERRIWPLSVVYTDYEPWILAWCCLRRGFRRFLISRVASVSETRKASAPPRAVAA